LFPGESLAGRLIFLAVVVVSFALFFLRAYRLYGLIRLGRPEARFDRIPRRIWLVLTHVLGQRKLFKRFWPGLGHALVFWGFLVLTLGTIQLMLEGLLPGVRIPVVGTSPLYVTVQDIFAFAVLVSVVGFAYRRAVIKPARLTTTVDAWIILSLIGILMVTLFLFEAFNLHLNPELRPWAPISSTLAAVLSAVDRSTAEIWASVFWWVHLLIVLGFLVYLPNSKHLHILTSTFTVLFYDLKAKGAMEPIPNIEEAEKFGVGRIEDFGWKQLLDLMACTECGRCDLNCPALLSAKPLSPKELVIDLKEALFERGGLALVGHQEGEAKADKPLVGGIILEETLWSCTSCRHCVTACPVNIEHLNKIFEMRRYLVMEESNFPTEIIPLFNNLERNGNPWQEARSSRAQWAQELGVKTLAEKPDAQILYWMGCMASFDARNRKVATAFIKIMQAAGVDFAILGREEACTGDPARRIGNEYLFQMLAQSNVETLNGYNVRRIVTACPHCFNTLKNEYPQFGGHYEVLHHSQFIAQLIAEGRIRLPQGWKSRVTFHDPCYLGRYNDVYDQPRDVLRAIPKFELVEMERTRERSFCCGAGGGRAWMEEHTGRRINQMRVEQALAANPDTLAAACPFCMTMFEDGIKGVGAQDRLKVLDIAELVAQSLDADTP
jgi:Fe-S oxidoreductase/nitrate reductase gamma subunit